MKVSIAVITANRAAILNECLASLFKSEYPLHEVFVYDNASTDNTAQMLAENFPKVKHIVNQKNMGLSFCHNMAMQNFTGDCIFLLDDDNMMEADMMTHLVEHLYSSDSIGIVSPLIYNYEAGGSICTPGGATSMWSGRNLLNPVPIEFEKKYYDSKRAPNSTLIKREVIAKNGLMDIALFSTLADEDYVRRMNVIGYQCHIVLAATIYHRLKIQSADPARSVGATNPARAYILARNRTVLVRRYAKNYQFLLFIFSWQFFFNGFYLYTLAIKARNWSLTKGYLLGMLAAWRYVFTKKLPPLEYVLELTK